MFSSIVIITISLIVQAYSMDAELSGPADYERDGIQHKYRVEFVTGSMDYQPKPMPIDITLLKKVNDYEGVGDGADLSPSFQFKSNSKYQFDFVSDMPFNQVDYFILSWQDLNEVYGAVSQIKFETATLTETTSPRLSSTKKFCADETPKNFIGSLADAEFHPC